MIETSHLQFGYTNNPLFNKLNLRVTSGEVLYIEGQNGAGKSTLLRILVGLIHPQEGQVMWQGQPIKNCLFDYLQNLTYLGHQNGLNAALTLEENLQLDWKNKKGITHLKPYLDELGLTPHLTTPIGHLSKGQQRKSALMRFRMQTTKLWVLDEPFTAVDAGSTEIVIQWMKEHLLNGGMMIFTSHQKLLSFNNIHFLCL